jgi:uncharacterized protein (TIGR03000 family)
MVRRWFSITAVLAIAVLMMAADASQGRERRWGRRARRSDSYVSSVPVAYTSSTEQGVAADMQTDGRVAGYYEPGRGGRARPVLLEVHVPAEAEIWIDGEKTVQKGAVRQYISPPIEPGRQYTYEIKVKWMDKDGERSQTRAVAVRAGDRRMVDLTKLAEEKQ